MRLSFRFFLLFFAVFVHRTVASDDWSYTASNGNSTAPVAESIDVAKVLAKRKEVLDAFKEELGLTDKEAKKVIHRLRKIILDDKDAVYAVDLFLADTVPTETLQAVYTPSFSVSINLLKGKDGMTVKQNGVVLTEAEAKTVFAQAKDAAKAKRALYREARKQNLQKLIKVLEKELAPAFISKLEEAAEKGVPYVSLELPVKTIEKLLKKEPDALMAVDMHTQFSVAGEEQEPHAGDSPEMAEWRARFNLYLDMTGVNQFQAPDGPVSLYNSKGEDVGIYYSDVECPTEQNVTDGTAVFTGYTPPAPDRYSVLYFDNNPANDGNLIDDACTDPYYYDRCEYNKQVHTKVVTGIISTVSPEATLYCKGAHFSSFGDHNYSDPIYTVYEDIIPTESESSFVSVESYSLNRYNSVDEDNDTRDYYPMDRVFDNHSYDFDVPIFISAGNNINENPDHDVVSPAKAFNVITVGNYGLDDENLSILNTSSAYNDPLLDGAYPYQKPEISAPGTNFYVQYRKSATSSVLTDLFESNGTSYATPFAAGMTADLMSAIRDAHNDVDYTYGAAYKAAAIAMARDKVYVENHEESEYRSYVGEGGLDIESGLPLWSRYKQGASQADVFTENVNGKMCYTGWEFIELQGSVKVRFVIAWFNRLNDADISHIPNSYTLEVLDPQGNSVPQRQADGSYTFISNEPNQGYQVADFTLKNAPEGNYTARVCETAIHDNLAVKLGFAASQVEYTPPTAPAPGVLETIITGLLLD